MADADAQAAADTIFPLIRRVAPGALEKAELQEGSGLETDEIRAALELLKSKGWIEETDDGYRVPGAADSIAPERPKAKGDGEEEDEDEPGATDPAVPQSVPGTDQGYRATLEIVLTYGGRMRDEAAMAQAAAMEEEVADAIHKLYPGGIVAVDVKKVEAYKPRVIFDREGAEEE